MFSLVSDFYLDITVTREVLRVKLIKKYTQNSENSFRIITDVKVPEKQLKLLY